MTIKELQTSWWMDKNMVRCFNYFNLYILTEEAELLNFRKYGEQSFKEGEESNLAEEMSDILFVLICLANQTNIDLESAFKNKLILRTKRDSQRHMSNNKLWFNF